MTDLRSSRFSPALRDRLGDVGCLLGGLVVGGMATDVAGPLSPDLESVNALVGLAAIATLWWRRAAPLVVAALTFVAAAFAPLAAGAAIMAVYTVAARRPLRIGVTVAALYLAPGAIGALAGAGGGASPSESALGAVVLTIAALGWGRAARSRREAMEALAARAERAEAASAARVSEARRAERARIAVEMHDTLAHRLSLLSLHAGAIELRPEVPAADLSRSAGVIRETAHAALEELRAVLGVLRSDDDADLAPVPTLADLEVLLGEARAAGMTVEVDGSVGDLAVLPPDLGRHAYRVVQEGLTNARRHAPDAPVRLALEGEPGGNLVIEVTNPTSSRRAKAEPGLGLVGLRERVSTVGGTLHAGEEAGVHRLRADLPWRP